LFGKLEELPERFSRVHAPFICSNSSAYWRRLLACVLTLEGAEVAAEQVGGWVVLAVAGQAAFAAVGCLLRRFLVAFLIAG
jgi:hypothetical protein